MWKEATQTLCGSGWGCSWVYLYCLLDHKLSCGGDFTLGCVTQLFGGLPLLAIRRKSLMHFCFALLGLNTTAHDCIFPLCSMFPSVIPDCDPTISPRLYHICMAPISVSTCHVPWDELSALMLYICCPPAWVMPIYSHTPGLSSSA